MFNCFLNVTILMLLSSEMFGNSSSVVNRNVTHLNNAINTTTSTENPITISNPNMSKENDNYIIKNETENVISWGNILLNKLNPEDKTRQTKQFFTGQIREQHSPEEFPQAGSWKNGDLDGPKQREIDDAADMGLNSMKELLEVKEPLWYRLGE